MGTVTLPNLNQTGDNEWEDVEGNDRALRDEINGSLQNVNIASDAQISHSKLADGTAGQLLIANASGVITGTAMSGDVTISSGGVTAIGATKVTAAMLNADTQAAYRTLLTGGSSMAEGNGVGPWYFIGNDITFEPNPGLGTTRPLMVYLDSTDYALASLTGKLRIRAQQATNSTGPGVTCTVGLYPVESISAAVYTIGNVVAGSTVAFASTAADTIDEDDSGDFNIPTAGLYVVGVANSGVTAAGSTHDLFFELQQRLA